MIDFVESAELKVKRSKMRKSEDGRGSRGARAIYKVTRVDTRSTLGFFSLARVSLYHPPIPDHAIYVLPFFWALLLVFF